MQDCVTVTGDIYEMIDLLLPSQEKQVHIKGKSNEVYDIHKSNEYQKMISFLLSCKKQLKVKNIISL